MVSSIITGPTGAGALGVDPRYAGNGQAALQPRGDGARAGDRVDVADTASWAAARESVRQGLAQVHRTLALGADAQSMLLQVLQLARGESEGGQDQIDALLSAYAERVESTLSDGAGLAAGSALSVQAEPSALPVEVKGADLRLTEAPAGRDLLQVSQNAKLDDPELAQAAQRSLDAVQKAMEKLLDAARALEVHQGFLGAAEGASVRGDLDADGARLLALQVRQGLDAVGNRGIANVEPQAVLSLFRA